MADKAYWPNSKGLKKVIGGKEIFLGKVFDLTHGKGWFCQVFGGAMLFSGPGFGFHKTNKFTAVRKAIKNFESRDYLLDI